MAVCQTVSQSHSYERTSNLSGHRQRQNRKYEIIVFGHVWRCGSDIVIVIQKKKWREKKIVYCTQTKMSQPADLRHNDYNYMHDVFHVFWARFGSCALWWRYREVDWEINFIICKWHLFDVLNWIIGFPLSWMCWVKINWIELSYPYGAKHKFRELSLSLGTH